MRLKTQKRVFGFIAMTIIFLFILTNSIIVIQAYALTHYNENALSRYTDSSLSATKKFCQIIGGLDIPRPRNTKELNNNCETRHILTADSQKLEVWLIHTNLVKKGIIICFHGYMDEKSSLMDRANVLLKMGYDVMLVDCMGSGGSYGNQTTFGYYEAQNVKAAYDYSIASLQEDNIILLGFSMGSIAVLKAQYEYDMLTKGIILEAPYISLKKNIKQRFKNESLPSWPTSNLLTYWIGKLNGFDTSELNTCNYASKITTPVLLMHGMNDPYTSKEEIEEIYDNLASSQKELKFFSNAGHESYLKNHKQEWELAVREFFTEIESKNIFN